MKKKIILLVAGMTLAMSTFAACGRLPKPEVDVVSDATTEADTESDTESDTEDDAVVDGEVIDGGSINNSDPDAPKEIESVEITEFYAKFYSGTRFYDDEMGGSFYEFIIQNENGKLVASETNTGLRAEADDELLSSLAEYISDEGLAMMNGTSDVTAGLPPEYQPCEVDVTYSSGENIYFTYDNNPYDEWSEKLVDVFADWFSKQGMDGLYIAEPEQVTELFIDFYEDGIWYMYGGAEVEDDKAIDGENYLLEKSVSDVGEQKSLEGSYVVFPDDYYERIGEIVSKYSVYRKYRFSSYSRENNDYSNHDNGYFGMGTNTDADEADSSDTLLEIEIEYESGERVFIETKKPSELEGLRSMLTELMDYHDSLFEE